MYGVPRNCVFLDKFREMIFTLMELEPRLVILFYPNHAFIASSRPFTNKYLMLSSVSRACLYADRVWIKEGEPITLKVFVSHNLPAATFNSIEFSKAADNLDGAVSVSVIYYSTVVKAGYI